MGHLTDKGLYGEMAVEVLDKPAARALASAGKLSERNENPSAKADFPPEGPHARPHLINEDATPGTGLFSGNGHMSGDVDPGAG